MLLNPDKLSYNRPTKNGCEDYENDVYSRPVFPTGHKHSNPKVRRDSRENSDDVGTKAIRKLWAKGSNQRSTYYSGCEIESEKV